MALLPWCVELRLFADYFQFYLQDDDIEVGDLSEAWSEDAVQRLRIAVVSRAIGVGTARNVDVAVSIEVRDDVPPLTLEVAEHVVEADLEVRMGRVVVAGCTDDFKDARRLELPAGLYRVRVVYTDRRPEADGLGDMLSYRVILWPARTPGPVTVLKQGPIPWSG